MTPRNRIAAAVLAGRAARQRRWPRPGAEQAGLSKKRGGHRGAGREGGRRAGQGHGARRRRHDPRIPGFEGNPAGHESGRQDRGQASDGRVQEELGAPRRGRSAPLRASRRPQLLLDRLGQRPVLGRRHLDVPRRRGDELRVDADALEEHAQAVSAGDRVEDAREVGAPASEWPAHQPDGARSEPCAHAVSRRVIGGRGFADGGDGGAPPRAASITPRARSGVRNGCATSCTSTHGALPARNAATIVSRWVARRPARRPHRDRRLPARARHRPRPARSRRRRRRSGPPSRRSGRRARRDRSDGIAVEGVHEVALGPARSGDQRDALTDRVACAHAARGWPRLFQAPALRSQTAVSWKTAPPCG